MIDTGDKVIFKGVEHTVLNTFWQTMVQIIDDNDHVRSVPLAQVISETMNEIAPTQKDTNKEQKNG